MTLSLSNRKVDSLEGRQPLYHGKQQFTLPQRAICHLRGAQTYPMNGTTIKVIQFGRVYTLFFDEIPTDM